MFRIFKKKQKVEIVDVIVKADYPPYSIYEIVSGTWMVEETVLVKVDFVEKKIKVLGDKPIDFITLYSFMMNVWKDDNRACYYRFPFVAITREWFEVGNGWELCQLNVTGAYWKQNLVDGRAAEVTAYAPIYIHQEEPIEDGVTYQIQVHGLSEDGDMYFINLQPDFRHFYIKVQDYMLLDGEVNEMRTWATGFTIIKLKDGVKVDERDNYKDMIQHCIMRVGGF